MLISLMSTSVNAQDLLQYSIYGYRDTVVKTIFETGRKSKVETVYHVRKNPISVSYQEVTQYYRQNDSFVVYASVLDESSSSRKSYVVMYYDSNFRLVKSESSRNPQREYIYDDSGRMIRCLMYKNKNISGVIEKEFHDNDKFFIERVYRIPYELVKYAKTFYDSTGEYTVSYYTPDSTKDWADTTNYMKYSKLWKMALTGQISNAVDADISVVKNVIHEFDSDNNPITFTYIDNNNLLIKVQSIIYGAYSRILEENIVRANGDTIYRMLYFYDHRDNLIETRMGATNSSPIDTERVITTYTYDKLNRLLIRKTVSGESASILSNKYDDRGDLIEYKVIDKGVLKMLSEYKYEY